MRTRTCAFVFTHAPRLASAGLSAGHLEGCGLAGACAGAYPVGLRLCLTRVCVVWSLCTLVAVGRPGPVRCGPCAPSAACVAVCWSPALQRVPAAEVCAWGLAVWGPDALGAGWGTLPGRPLREWCVPWISGHLGRRTPVWLPISHFPADLEHSRVPHSCLCCQEFP